MPLSKAHKEQTRQRILQAAIAVFTEHGYSAVTIDEVMAEAGLTRGGFYAHFKSKADLFVEVVRAGEMGEVSPGWVLARSGRGSAFDHLVRAYLSRDHLSNSAGACPLIAFPEDAARGSAEIKAAYTDVARSIAEAFEAVLEEDGAEEASLAALALCVGGMVIARSTDDAAFSERVREACARAASVCAGLPVSS